MPSGGPRGRLCQPLFPTSQPINQPTARPLSPHTRRRQHRRRQDFVLVYHEYAAGGGGGGGGGAGEADGGGAEVERALWALRGVAGSLRPVATERNPLAYDRIDIKGHLEKLQACVCVRVLCVCVRAGALAGWYAYRH